MLKLTEAQHARLNEELIAERAARAPKPCAFCEVTFKPRSARQRFCRDACKLSWHRALKKVQGHE